MPATRIPHGLLEDGALRGTSFEDPVPTGQEVPLDDVRLLAPVLPWKVIGVGKNLPAHEVAPERLEPRPPGNPARGVEEGPGEGVQ